MSVSSIRIAPAAALLILIVAISDVLNGSPLDIYFLDMSGGESILLVTPLGESLLVDSGSRTPEHRDADRILKAAEDAGVTRINKVITTHFHSDHFGAILRVAEKIPIDRFYDKGHTHPKEEAETFERLFSYYQKATGGNTITVRAGDLIPLSNDPSGALPPLGLRCIAAEKKIAGFVGDIDAPVDGYEKLQPDYSDNARSIALIFTYGDFRFFMPADLTWNVEHHLVEPKNLIGTIDLLQVSHHGLSVSNNPLMLKEIEPAVCVIQNGPRKGSHPRVLKSFAGIASVEGIYQIHFNSEYGIDGNIDIAHIANPEGSAGGEYIKVSVDYPSRSYTVSLGRSGEKRTYQIRAKE